METQDQRFLIPLLEEAGLKRNSGAWKDYPTALTVIRKLNLRGNDVLRLAWLAVEWLGIPTGRKENECKTTS